MKEEQKSIGTDLESDSESEDDFETPLKNETPVEPNKKRASAMKSHKSSVRQVKVMPKPNAGQRFRAKMKLTKEGVYYTMNSKRLSVQDQAELLRTAIKKAHPDADYSQQIILFLELQYQETKALKTFLQQRETETRALIDAMKAAKK